jgi:outer membrane protein, multidrug efflux system
MHYSSLTVALLTAGLLGACSMMPEYQQPSAPIEAVWPSGEAYPNTRRDADGDIAWQSFFVDAQLRQLIALALEHNRDLRTAALNVEAYRALYQIQRADLFPSLGLDAGAVRQRLPADLSSTGQTATTSQYTVGLGVTAYELDFFGRVRSLEQAALESYLGEQEAQRSVQLSLTASVATAWLTLRCDQAQLKLARETLRADVESLQLIRLRFKSGTASELDVRQARTAVDSAQSTQAQYLRLVAQDANNLQLLIGTSLPTDLAAAEVDDDSILAELPVGLPASVVARRPDIRQAEHRLKSANANIGAARAAFFPTITLTASAGSASSELSSLFSGGQGAWSFVPSISLPIFNSGRLAANLDYSRVQKDINVAAYEKAIQVAFREVADGLAARKTYRAQLTAEAELVKDSQGYLALAEQRYRTGVDSYLTVLDAQRSLYGAQQQQINSRSLQLAAEISLYKALGGGWN